MSKRYVQNIVKIIEGVESGRFGEMSMKAKASLMRSVLRGELATVSGRISRSQEGEGYWGGILPDVVGSARKMARGVMTLISGKESGEPVNVEAMEKLLKEV